MSPLCTYRLNWARKTSWGGEIKEMTLPPDIEFEIRAPAVRDWARYLWVTVAPHNIKSLRVSGEETFCLFETWRPECDSNPRPPTFYTGSFSHCTRTPFWSLVPSNVISWPCVGSMLGQLHRQTTRIMMLMLSQRTMQYAVHWTDVGSAARYCHLTVTPSSLLPIKSIIKFSLRV